MSVKVIDPVKYYGWRVVGQTPEFWTKKYIVTANRTEMGWLISVYDLNTSGWSKIGSFYGIGKGTWLFHDEEVSTVREHDKRPKW